MHPLREAILAGRICRHLRTKAMFVAGHEGGLPPEMPYLPDAAVFWCNRSGWAMGPDVLPANPERCLRGRLCFEPEVEA